MTEPIKSDNTYELHLRILGNEVFAIGLSSSSLDNKWVAIAIVSIFSALTLIGAYGDKFVALFQRLTA
jgi:hypothetical protein